MHALLQEGASYALAYVIIDKTVHFTPTGAWRVRGAGDNACNTPKPKLIRNIDQALVFKSCKVTICHAPLAVPKEKGQPSSARTGPTETSTDQPSTDNRTPPANQRIETTNPRLSRLEKSPLLTQKRLVHLRRCTTLEIKQTLNPVF